MNRIEMINEDLMARALRDEVTIGKLRCIEIGMENKFDDLVSENDQLRLMHRKVVGELEEVRAGEGASEPTFGDLGGFNTAGQFNFESSMLRAM